MNKFKKIIIYLISFYLIYFMCNNFILISNAVNNCVSLCISMLIPAIFPFFVLSEIIMYFSPLNYGKILTNLYERMFRFPKETIPVFVSGLLCGYPVGASCVLQAYENDIISKKDGEQLICFTNNCGPLFVICSVGAGIIGNIKYGIILYIIHILSSIFTGIIIGRKRKNAYSLCHCVIHKKFDFKIIENSFIKCIKICGTVIFFSIVTTVIQHLIPGLSGVIISSLFEITNGIKNISGIFDIKTSLCLISFLMSFSGVSVLMQVSTVTKNIFNLKKYLIYKTINGIISCLLTYIFLQTEFNNIIKHKPQRIVNIILVIMLGYCMIILIKKLIKKQIHIKENAGVI